MLLTIKISLIVADNQLIFQQLLKLESNTNKNEECGEGDNERDRL